MHAHTSLYLFDYSRANPDSIFFTPDYETLLPSPMPWSWLNAALLSPAVNLEKEESRFDFTASSNYIPFKWVCLPTASSTCPVN